MIIPIVCPLLEGGFSSTTDSRSPPLSLARSRLRDHPRGLLLLPLLRLLLLLLLLVVAYIVVSTSSSSSSTRSRAFAIVS